MGYDNISTDMVKISSEVIAPILCRISNLMLENGTYPDQMKIAKVIALFKGGDAKNIENYRPISLLPIINRILEKIIYNRIFKFLDRNNFFYCRQYGFRQNYSTEIAASELIDDISKNLTKKNICALLFIDLKKAFDWLHKNVILYKCHKAGIRGTALKLIESYLSNRFQFTTLNNKNSNLNPIEYGAPQGSILGPEFF